MSKLIVQNRRGNKFRFLKGQAGFSLIEVLIAVVLLGFIGVAVLRGLDTSSRNTNVLDEKVMATNVVTAYLENIKQLPYSDTSNPYPTAGYNVTIPSQFENPVPVIEYSDDAVHWYSTSNNGQYKLQKITITITTKSGKPVLTTCTFRAKR